MEKNTSGQPSAKRIGQLKKAVKEQRARLSNEETVKSRLEKSHAGKDGKEKEALDQFPLLADYDEKMSDEAKQQKFKESIIRAEVRKQVSKAIFEEDKNLGGPERQEIIDRQINRYYGYHLGNKKLRGHIDAPHGTAPSKKFRNGAMKKR
jgi:hypothetical protein